MEPRGHGRFCASCQLEVVDVSARTETEARDMLRRRGQERVCVSYLVNRDGTIRLAPEPSKPDVPTTALVRRGARVLAAASIALAACGPGPAGRLAGEPVATVQTIPDEPCERLGGAVMPLEIPEANDAGVAVPPTPLESTPVDLKPGRETQAPADPDEARMLGELAY